jgi:hypothetical protein
MTLRFGPTFGDEVIAAGLGGLPFSWCDDGTINGRDALTEEQNAELDAVVAAHDPTKQVRTTTVLSQDLMAQFTPADVAAIQTAISSDTSKMLLWYSLLAQRDPMHVNNDRFLAGWRALIDVLGIDRMNAIAAALGVSI